MKMIFMVGIQGSGKTTFAKQYCEENQNTFRVSRDDLRNMRGVYWIPEQEKLITRVEDACIKEALNAGMDVLVDAMNLNKHAVRARYEKFKGLFSPLVLDFNIITPPLEECIRRDSLREGTACIGESIIRKSHEKLLSGGWI